MKRFVHVVVLSLLVFILFGCSSYRTGDLETGGSGGSGEASGEPDDHAYKSGGEFIGGEYIDDPGQQYQPPQAGQLTASEWSDIQNYDFYQLLFVSSQSSEVGIFTDYLNKGYFETLNMISVSVKNSEEALSNANVQLLSGAQDIIYEAVTNVLGNAYLFPKSDQLEIIKSLRVTHNGETISEPYEYDLQNNTLEIDLAASNNKEDVIELMFVIDTTGSMGDEITYLKAEIDYVIGEVQTDNPNSIIKLALMFYRDFGDEYVTRYFDFTTDISTQKVNLSLQYAAGGGDFEEAVDVALDEAIAKNWSDSNTTKLLFHVLDARPHYTQTIMTNYYNAIYNASKKGIRIIPVASSGIDKYTEYLLRNEAMMTGGTYIFLTNHSGIGGDHLEATVGETVVEYLNHLIIRLINEYHTGIALEKVPYDQK